MSPALYVGSLLLVLNTPVNDPPLSVMSIDQSLSLPQRKLIQQIKTGNFIA